MFLTDPEHPTLPASAAQSWRLWLMTGIRRDRVDRRRLRGAHLGLKKVLLENMVVRGEPPYGWKEFSDAMLRHAIGDAVRTLPDEDGRLLKLAYFGGFSNREIARQVGLTEAAVASRLRRAIDAISDQIQRAGTMVRRAAYAFAGWLAGRWCENWLHHAAEASSVAAVALVVLSGGAAPVDSALSPSAPLQTDIRRADLVPSRVTPLMPFLPQTAERPAPVLDIPAIVADHPVSTGLPLTAPAVPVTAPSLPAVGVQPVVAAVQPVASVLPHVAVPPVPVKPPKL
jgi:hypothetical protein